jgi:hypothetical protein
MLSALVGVADGEEAFSADMPERVIEANDRLVGSLCFRFVRDVW